MDFSVTFAGFRRSGEPIPDCSANHFPCMKKKLLLYTTLFCIVFRFSVIAADPPVEGMWLPMLLDQLNIPDMQANGLKLSAEDLYSVNHSSMKDAVLLFGSGCTGEVVSGEGLVLTNHHCGLGQIQKHSSVEHDYITNGFWAMNRNEELTCPGLTVTFIVSMEDVTSDVVSVLKDGISEMKRNTLIDSISKVIAMNAIQGTHYGAQVKAFYTGNQFYLIKTETFRDVRLVGAPPISIGNFGGETDNWIWPRQTGDFSIFRIYANANNEPADYSPDNVPFKPRYFFPVSTGGVKEGDFTMVYGFPGRTNEYATSYAIDLTQNVSDPNRVKIRDKILTTWWNDMIANDTMRIQYASKYYGLGNAWKKWQGEILGLKKSDAIFKKQQYESEFTSRISANASWNNKYKTVLPGLKRVYDSIKLIQPEVDYYEEALTVPEIFHFASSFQTLAELSAGKAVPAETVSKEVEKLKASAAAFFKNYSAGTDQKLTSEMMNLYSQNIGLSKSPPALQDAMKKFSGDGKAFSAWLFSASFFDDQKAVMAFLDNYHQGDEKKIMKDAAYRISTAINDYGNTSIYPELNKLRNESTVLNRQYMAAQLDVMKEKKFYPDANLTLRITYGKVEGYSPRNGVDYAYATTLDGVMEKMNPEVEDYKVPDRLKELYAKKDYGDYADASGEMRTCFIASNHTSGGNSGSPVIDGEGRLVGINFDRVWEGTMSDLFFDTDECRNISLDIRYLLFVVDKYAGAGYLLKEMKLER